jgi:hypothetical protein
MGDIAESDRPAAVPAADLEYDLAHEAPLSADETDRDPAERGVDPDEPRHVHVVTETAYDGGDYGYDLAHDVPGGWE